MSQAISECREAGMNITNEKRAVKGRVLSFYKYEPESR